MHWQISIGTQSQTYEASESGLSFLSCLHVHACVLSSMDTILEVTKFSMSVPVKARTAYAFAKYKCCCVRYRISQDLFLVLKRTLMLSTQCRACNFEQLTKCRLSLGIVRQSETL